MRQYPFMNAVFWMVLVMGFLVLVNGAVFPGDFSCLYCGMNRSVYGHSWVEIHYDDGSSGGFCSVHCASVDMALHADKVLKMFLVSDYNTKKLIDADKAYWLIGGSKMGVMTARAKWAFEKKRDADNFKDEYGGEPATFELVLKAAFEDMYQDILMIQNKREMMRMRKMESQEK